MSGGGGEGACAGHGVDDGVSALGGGVGVCEGVVGGGGLDYAGEKCCLGDGEVFGVGVEVGVCGFLDAVGAVAEVDEVEVSGEDFVFGEVFVKVGGEFHFAEFAGDGVFVGGVAFGVGVGFDQHEIVFDVLLVEGGCPLGDGAVGDVGEHGSGGSAEVDAVVVVESAVFDGHDGFLHGFRDVGGCDRCSALGVEGGEGIAVTVGHGGGLGDVRGGDVLVVGVHGGVSTVDGCSGGDGEGERAECDEEGGDEYGAAELGDGCRSVGSSVHMYTLPTGGCCEVCLTVYGRVFWEKTDIC